MLKAIISFIQIFLLSAGLIPVSYEIDYGGNDFTPPVISEPLYLVEDSETEYCIVIPDADDLCINTAVEELQAYFEKVSGAKPECVRESDYISGTKAIHIGKTALAQQHDGVISQLSEDGFLLLCESGDLLIAGNDSRATLFGVYTFLEDYLGVRWFTPELEVVPENDDIIIDKNLNRTVEPSFAVRRNSCVGSSNQYRARMKTNVSFWYESRTYGGAMNFVLWDVTLPDLVPDSLFAEHPEYFAMNPDGTRTTDHVCLSHPDVLGIAVENARKAINSCTRSTADHIHIGQKDNSNYCHCPTCEELYERYGAISAPTIIFTNAFADALDEEFPEFTFTFYAYGETDRPPTDMSLRCNDNVVPVLCELHRACRCHPLTQCGAIDGDESFMNLYGESEPMVAEDFAAWVKLADRTYIYDYTINFLWSAQFFANLATIQSTMKYMHDIGITGYVYNCGDGHQGAFNELRNYLYCKVQWDVNCDVEYHMTDFLKAYYGEEAAPYIKEILDIQTAQISATAHSFDFDWHYQSGYYPIHTIIKLDSLWKKALSADITEEQLFNVETASLSWEFFKANQFLGKYFFLNPGRIKAQEELYDELTAHGITKVSSFSDLPAKEEINFINRPIEW